MAEKKKKGLLPRLWDTVTSANQNFNATRGFSAGAVGGAVADTIPETTKYGAQQAGEFLLGTPGGPSFGTPQTGIPGSGQYLYGSGNIMDPAVHAQSAAILASRPAALEPVAQPADQISGLKSLAAALFPQMSMSGVDVGAVVKPYDEAVASAKGTAEGGKAEIGAADVALRERLAALQGQANTANQAVSGQIQGDLQALLSRNAPINSGIVNDLAKQGASPQSQAIAQRAQVLNQGLEGQSALQQTLANRLAQAQANNTASLAQSADLTKTGALGTLQNNLDALLGQIGVKKADAQTSAQEKNNQIAMQNQQLAAQRAQGLLGLAQTLAKSQGESPAGPDSIRAPYVGRNDAFGKYVTSVLDDLDKGLSPEEVKASVNTDKEFKDAGYSAADVAKIIDSYAGSRSAGPVSPDLLGIFKQLLG